MLLPPLLVVSGCRDREITAYRAPRDPAPKADPSAQAQAPALPSATGELPLGHPPIDGSPAAPGGDQATMANTPVPAARGEDLTWTAPATWSPKPGASMRKGSYAATGPAGEADISVIPFPGDTGGLAANLNRWRSQVGLPAQSPAEVTAAAERFTSNGLEFTVVDYTGPDGTRMLGAVVPFEGNTWFFKLTGPAALLAAERENFLALLRTVKAPWP